MENTVTATGHSITNETFCKAVLLTFLSFFIIPARAEDQTRMIPMPVMAERPSNSALTNTEQQIKTSLLFDYMRKQGAALIPRLADDYRAPIGFAMRQWKSTEDVFSLEDSGTSIFSPVMSFIHPADNAEALWLSPGYHHAHGIMPFDDAVTFGINYRNALFGDRLKLNLRPFYAQNWHSTDDSWGFETEFAFGPDAANSWGKMVLRYNNGNSNLLDRGRGFDMHADFAFNDNISLSAGAHQNEQNDIGNYTLLRWKMPLGE